MDKNTLLAMMLAGGNGGNYGSPLVASTAAEMTDTDRVYVYTGSETGYVNGDWYYYDGDSWEVGGVYNSVAVETDDTLTQSGEAADAKATGDAITANALNIAPSYDSTADYKVGDRCIYGSDLYKCKTAISGGEAWNSAQWTACKVFEYDDIIGAYKITDPSTDLGDISTFLDSVNGAGDHILFDVGALGANAYLATIFIDQVGGVGIYKVTDLVKLRTYSGAYDQDLLLSTVLAMAYDVATRKEIDDLQAQINQLVDPELGDVVVFNRVKALSVTSTSGALSFTVTDEQDFINAVGECEAREYLLTWDGSKWLYNGEEITNFGITVTGTPITGEVMHVTETIDEEEYTVVDLGTTGTNATVPKDSSVTNYKIVEATYVGTESWVFDAPESAICVTPGYTLAAGTYYIYNVAGVTSDYWCNYKRLYYVFTIAHDIIATNATGDITLRFYQRSAYESTGDARGIYQLDCKPYCEATGALYNSDIISFVGQVAAPSNGETDLRTVADFTADQTMESEGIIYNNLGHVCYGNNEWGVSNMANRLNSSAKKMTPQRLHKNDVVTGLANVKGGMWGIDPRIKAQIATAVVSRVHALSDEFTKDTIYTTDNDCFLLSMKEMSFNINTTEGVVTALYDRWCNNTLTNSAVAERGKADRAGLAPSQHRWSSSPLSSNSGRPWSVSAAGASVNSYGAYVSVRRAPAYILKS